MKPGSKAPDFALSDAGGKTVKLRDLAGKWVVLYFYPKDDTPGCTVEACDFTEAMPRLGGALVLGVSPDSPERHKKFIDKHGLRVTLLSDPDHAVLAKYGAWGKKSLYGKSFDGVIRSTVLIDPEGRIAHHWPKVKAAGHAEEVREKLRELRSGAAGGDDKTPPRPSR